MVNYWLRYSVFGVLFALSACGGGGSDSNGAASGTPMTFSISSIDASMEIGTSAAVSFVATVDLSVVTGASRLLVVDEQGVFSGPIEGESISDAAATITLHTTADPGGTGVYTGVLKFYLCKDYECRSPYPGFPVTLPYKVLVKPAVVPPAISLSPNSISATVADGAPAQVTLTGVVAGQFLPSPYFAVNDPSGVVNSTVSAKQIDGANYELTVTLNAKALPGSYSGSLDLQVCNYVCSPSFDIVGSPVKIPYYVVVQPETLLQPTSTPSGLPDWEMYQGNAAHTGFVPTSLNVSQFKPRWTWNLGYPIHSVSVGSGKVFVSATANYLNTEAELFALNELDGAQAWSHNFGAVHALNPPSHYGGRVFVATSGYGDTYMWSFDANNGSLRFKTAFDSQWERYLAPTIKDSEVYTNGGYYGGLYRFYASGGLVKWFANLGQYHEWTPALDDTYAYAYTGAEFTAINRKDGTVAFTVADSGFNWNGYSIYGAPVVTGNDSVLVVNGTRKLSNSVIRYSVAGKGESWRLDGVYLNDPVVASGQFYISNATGNRVEVRQEVSGALLWSWQPPAGETLSYNNLILTNNLLFVSTNAATYAVDLGTRQSTWSVARTGNLALSASKVLYIADPAGRIDAYSLF